jgi:hypothetical protein
LYQPNAEDLRYPPDEVDQKNLHIEVDHARIQNDTAHQWLETHPVFLTSIDLFPNKKNQREDQNLALLLANQYH